MEKPPPPAELPELDAGAAVAEADIVTPRRAGRGRRARVPELKSPDHLNWLIHSLYIRQDFVRTMALVNEVLEATNEACEYALHIKAMLHRHRGEMETSLGLFQQAMHLNPHNRENAKQVARTLFMMARHAGAVDVYDQIISAGVRDWHILHNKAVCLSFLGKLDEAEACFNDALAEGSHEISFMELAKVLVQKGDIAAAITTLKKALVLSPEHAELLTTIGLLYLESGNSSKAFEKFGTALTYDATDPVAILGAGSVIQESDEFDVALIKYRVSAVKSPESASLWSNIGMCFYGKRKYVAAIACLKRAAYLNPHEWKISFNLGLVHLITKQFASAFVFLSSAVNLQPDFAQSYMLLGTALYHLDDAVNATTAMLKAVELDDSDALVYCNVAVVMLVEGNIDQAAKNVDLAIKNAATSEEAEEIVDTCSKLQESIVAYRSRETNAAVEVPPDPSKFGLANNEALRASMSFATDDDSNLGRL